MNEKKAKGIVEKAWNKEFNSMQNTSQENYAIGYLEAIDKVQGLVNIARDISYIKTEELKKESLEYVFKKRIQNLRDALAQWEKEK